MLDPERRELMNLALWLPALFLLGLATFAMLFAFLAGCEKV
jgi:hypothetical protein